ncbi:MAG: hypothetical protein WC242_03730 [Candidatus Paceibacterota bacterium]|jgi:hypothetical protein
MTEETVLQKARRLRGEIAVLQVDLDGTRRELDALEKSCRHDWTNPERIDDRVISGYQDHGDPPGTIGVDRRLPCYVPEQRFPRWMRKCRTCGLAQITEDFEEKTGSTKVPSFPATQH